MKKHYLLVAATLFTASTAIHIARVEAAPPGAKSSVQVAKSPLSVAQQQRGLAVTARLKRFLSRRISSPGGKLTMNIKPGARPDLGQFSEIVIAGNPMQLKKKLRISEFSMRARNIRIDTAALMREDDRELKTLKATTSVRAVLTEDDLTTMLARGRRSKEMNLLVRFQGDRIRVSGNWNWGWFSGPVTMIGKLRLAKSAGGNQVFFDILSLRLNGAPVPSFMQNKFSEKLNPLISYDDLPFLPQIRSIRFVGNKAVLST